MIKEALLSAILLFTTVPALLAQSSATLTGDAKAAWAAISSNIVRAADKMPAENYSFRPVAEVRTFGQVIGHITDVNYMFCSVLHAEKKSAPGAEKTLTEKAELVAALKESVSYCTSAAEQLTDAQAGDVVKLFGRDRAKLTVIYMNTVHDNEHYGNLVTYMRLKGLVPPSSEPRTPSASMRLHYDQFHGEAPPPKVMADISRTLGVETAASMQPITPESLKGSRVLYLRAPSKAFDAAEKDAIIAFVKGGGSLLLVLDEENRQSLAGTGVNDFIAPFGMKLTPDTEYLHNCGAIAKAGEINKADREIPYSGGRAVEGGTPFAYQLDKDGMPGQPFATWKRVDGGGRIVVMGEGMASLFLGVPNSQRLAGVPRDPSKTTYWGKDSATFMEEVLGWLVKR